MGLFFFFSSSICDHICWEVWLTVGIQWRREAIGTGLEPGTPSVTATTCISSLASALKHICTCSRQEGKMKFNNYSSSLNLEKASVKAHLPFKHHQSGACGAWVSAFQTRGKATRHDTARILMCGRWAMKDHHVHSQGPHHSEDPTTHGS